ncbi:MAG: 4-hydroxybenzoyl-CoA reductase subunit alpha [Chloroflexota bacterium]|nr:4-hydroxybenzoyl-CoA reductase subunit alpha [Chloroflexota bacterium]
MSEAANENRKYHAIGKTVPKIDARDKATGRAKYTGDLKMPGMIIGKILRSPHAHARIVKIDTSRAEALPGVKAVLTAKDVTSKMYGISPARYDETIFAIDKVLYVGDKVAGVAAVDEETAAKALSLIDVEYEVLPPVLDPLHAMDEDQPQIHPMYERNISVEIHQDFGDTEKALAEADYVRTDTFAGPRTSHIPMEGHTAISKYEDGKLTVWCSTQSTHYFQYYLARQFDLEMSDVRVIKTFVGGAFGGKLEPSGAEYVSAVLAMKTGRPVKIAFERWEVFVHHRGRHPHYMTLTTGLTKEGKILACKADMIIDGGAYTSLGIASAYYAGALLPLAYMFDNFKFDCFRVHTNLPSCAAQRGHGGPQPRYAFESHLDMIAQDLGIDPIEIRLRNARQPNTVTPNELAVGSCEFTAALEKAREVSGWQDKKGKLPSSQGIGVGCGAFISGAGYPIYRTNMPHSAATIRVSEQGDAAILYHGAIDMGQGTDTVLAQMAAEAIGINYEDMKVVAGDTDLTPVDLGAYSSRQTTMSGWAVKRAGDEVREKVLDLAAAMLEAKVEDLDIAEGIINVTGSPDKTITFKAVASEYFIRFGPLVGNGKYAPPKLGGKFKGAAVGTSPSYSFAAQVSQVKVDEETGYVDVTDVWDVHDCGTPINPQLLHAQVEGALFMGMGEAMYEQLLFDANGKPLNANLGEYRIPTALDVPNVVSELVDSYEPAGPWGVKEVGEGATLPTMGCYGNAIYDAIGIRIADLPLTPEKVWRAIQQRKVAEAEAAKK